MIEYSQELNEWAKELAEFHLPRWEELPYLNLYMDQVVAYINETLEFLLVLLLLLKKHIYHIN